MTDTPIFENKQDGVKYNVALNDLYNMIYLCFSKELRLSCPYSEFNSIIDKKQFISGMSQVLETNDIDSKTAHAAVLGYVAPGIHTSRSATGNVSPADAAASMFNIAKIMFPKTSFTAEQFAQMFNVDLDTAIEGMADAIAEGMKDFKVPPGANIFNRGGRGGGGKVNDEGELIIDPPRSNEYYHHEPVKNELNWDLGLENTMIGTEPFWDSGDFQTCFVAKFNMIQFPNEDVELRNYYENVLIPVLRNAVQGNKRYNADLATFFTYNMFKSYINEVIQSVSIYYFFANGFAYCNQPGLVNNNEALRYLRQEMFSTAQLQRFQQLGQLIESLPIPQTLINAIAQYHGWYSNSTESNATLYCNIPHGIFLDNLYEGSDVYGKTGCLDQLKTDIILDEITKLTSPFVNTGPGNEVTDQRNSDKFLGILLNTIPGWRNSTIGGSAFATDVYDEAHWNEFMNSPTVESTTIYKGAGLERSFHHLYPPYHSENGESTPYRYHTMGDKVPGYLQSYFTPLSWTIPGSYADISPHGIIKPQPRNCTWSISSTYTSWILGATYSNVIVWCNGDLYNNLGESKSKGFTLYPSPIVQAYSANIGSPIDWTFDDGRRFGSEPHVPGWVIAKPVQPPCTYGTINMSLNQCQPNRLIAVQKLLDVQDFFSLTSPGAPRENSKSGGRRGRRVNSKKAATAEDSSEDFKANQ